MKTYYKPSLTYLFILVSLCTYFFTGCNRQKTSSNYLSKQNYVLGTIVTISLYEHQSEDLLEAAFDKLSELEKILSINQTNTLINTLNHNAGITPITVDTDTFNLVQKSLYYSELTSGAFDISIGPIVKLWNIGFPSARVPSQKEINSNLPLVDYHLVHLDETAQTIYLEKPGMQLDLGGIGKGYAADVIATLLRDAGVEHAIIDIGGNIYALGDKPGNQLWHISIQDPFNPRGNIMGTLSVANQSIVTSGIYERYLTADDGTIYHHILNPKTGYPFTNELTSVTIISDSSADGDALSTASFALGIKEGLPFIENLKGVDAIFITADKEVYTTSGIKDSFTLSNKEFILVN